MDAWSVPAASLVFFIALLIWASRLVRRRTGRARLRGIRGLLTLAIGVAVSMTFLENFVSLSRPWMLMLAGVVAGLWSLIAQALFGEKSSAARTRLADRGST
jgi:hypothetical protein